MSFNCGKTLLSKCTEKYIFSPFQNTTEGILAGLLPIEVMVTFPVDTVNHTEFSTNKLIIFTSHFGSSVSTSFFPYSGMRNPKANASVILS